MDYCTLLIWITYKQTIPSHIPLVSFKRLNNTIQQITNTNTVLYIYIFNIVEAQRMSSMKVNEYRQ